MTDGGIVLTVISAWSRAPATPATIAASTDTAMYFIISSSPFL
jgi:hypothetical protein